MKEEKHEASSSKTTSQRRSGDNIKSFYDSERNVEVLL
jgi:hypothetical protein